MSVLSIESPAHVVRKASPVLRTGGGRQRRVEPVTDRVRRDGKFFRLGDQKFYVKGVTYGPFAPNANGEYFASPTLTGRKDFEQILDLGANCVRIYHIPPKWFLDLAQEMGLKIFLDVCWPKNLEFCQRPRGRRAGPGCGPRGGPTVRQPPGDVRDQRRQRDPAGARPLHGQRARRAVHRRAGRDRQGRGPQLPGRRSPTSRPPNTSGPATIDFVCFNVYLDDEQVFRNYLARLQNIAGDLPLMLGEYGIDTIRRASAKQQQAEMLDGQVRAVFDEGLVGTFIFSYTDDWFAHGWQIDDWAFGLSAANAATTARSRSPRSTRSRTSSARVPQVTDAEAAQGAASSSARTTARARSNRACGRCSGSDTRTTKWSSSTTGARTTRRRS